MTHNDSHAIMTMMTSYQAWNNLGLAKTFFVNQSRCVPIIFCLLHFICHHDYAYITHLTNYHIPLYPFLYCFTNHAYSVSLILFIPHASFSCTLFTCQSFSHSCLCFLSSENIYKPHVIYW